MPPASVLVALLVAGELSWPGALAVDARALDDWSEAPRLRAIERFAARAGAQATPFLLPLLRDPDPGVRLYVARRLVRSGERTAVDAAVAWIVAPAVAPVDRPFGLDVLREAPTLSPSARRTIELALHDPDATIRALALEALERHDLGPSLPAVLGAFDDDNREVRSRAVRLAGGSGDPRVALSLLGRFDDVDRQVRLDAIRACATQPGTLPALLRLAADGADEARLAAVDALGALAAPTAAPLLTELARRRPADELARHAMLALGKLSTPAAIATLVSLIRAPPIAEEAKAALRRAGPAAVPALVRELDRGNPTGAAVAADALGDIGDRHATTALATAIDTRSDLAPLLLDALGRLADPAALPALARASESPDPRVRRGALSALLVLGDGRASAVLEHSLADPDARARELAARLAEALADRGATPALLPLVDDADADVRRAAEAALARVASPSRPGLAAILASIARPDGGAREPQPAPRRERGEAEWQLLGAVLDRLSDAADADRLAAAFVAARGPERAALARGLAAAGTASSLSDRALIDQLVRTLAEGGALALAAADALAAARVPDGARAALAGAFAAAEPAVKARLCAAIARTPGGGSWLAALIASPREPVEVRAAAAWAARGAPEAKDALAAATSGEGPLAANARAAQTVGGRAARPVWTEVRVQTPDGTTDAGRWISVSAPGGVVVWAMTDPYGAVRLEALPEGALALEAPGSLLRRAAP